MTFDVEHEIKNSCCAVGMMVDRMPGLDRAITARAHAHIDSLVDGYAEEDRLREIFKRRSEGQKRRFANQRKFNGGGK